MACLSSIAQKWGGWVRGQGYLTAEFISAPLWPVGARGHFLFFTPSGRQQSRGPRGQVACTRAHVSQSGVFENLALKPDFASILILCFISCVTWVTPLNFSEPWFPHLYTYDKYI